MDSEAPSPAGMEEILQLFAGRRRSARVECEKGIDCVGPSGSYHGHTLNVSRLGALIEIRNEGFLPPGSTGSLMEVAALVHDVFPDGMTIRFRHVDVEVGASVQRVAQHPRGASAVLGCQFKKPLTRRQCTALGVEPTQADAGLPPAE